ncbi:MAG: type I DNA topoisomerase [Holosporales bacterium]|nr:type I DNA topoisomerase [Holosporales bacterium]
MKKSETLVIVESPAKASTIERYLGDGFKVFASYGHVRDLLSKNGSVDPENDFSMKWAESEKNAKRVNDIISAAKKSATLVLATDPDREGEAIAWHLSEILKERLGSAAPAMQRIVFHEITKNAVCSALQSPKAINQRLVDAYLARRALDYLVGYSLSPILWRKLPGSRSAGRVQSVALRLLVDREQEIEKFESQEYWSIGGFFTKSGAAKSEIKATIRITRGQAQPNSEGDESARPSTAPTHGFQANLACFGGKKLSKLDISSLDQAKQMSSTLSALSYEVAEIEKKQVQRNPAPPFTTSTMQQEASRKLGFSVVRTMRLAQFLYEGVQIEGEKTGLITYMRTDSTHISEYGVTSMRDFILETYGKKYLPKSARVYKTKAKNAQEAHEAIRPTDISRRPADVARFLDKDQLALYDLIWKRAVASQMENALFDQVAVDITDEYKKHVFRATGTTQLFDGFLRVYQTSLDEEETDEVAFTRANRGGDGADGEHALPVLTLNERLALNEIVAGQHFTKPPPRFTEASLVKKLEELGIGRPSTYASMIQVLQDRGYAALEKRQFIPSERGRIVTGFLTNFCQKYVEYDFTARLEDELDEISNGEAEWKNVMHGFWTEFSQAVNQMKTIPITDVIDRLEEALSSHIFKNLKDRKCPKCGDGTIGLRLSKFGAFLGCSRYPECLNRESIGADTNTESAEPFEAVEIGVDPADGAKILLRKGPYGFYIQAETVDKKGKAKIKRVGVPAGIDPHNISLSDAIFLKNLPVTIGELDGEEVCVNTGRFGPYVKFGSIFASIPKGIDFRKITFEEAAALIKKKQEQKTKRPRPAQKRAAKKAK